MFPKALGSRCATKRPWDRCRKCTVRRPAKVAQERHASGTRRLTPRRREMRVPAMIVGVRMLVVVIGFEGDQVKFAEPDAALGLEFVLQRGLRRRLASSVSPALASLASSVCIRLGRPAVECDSRIGRLLPAPLVPATTSCNVITLHLGGDTGPLRSLARTVSSLGASGAWGLTSYSLPAQTCAWRRTRRQVRIRSGDL